MLAWKISGLVYVGIVQSVKSVEANAVGFFGLVTNENPCKPK